MQKKVGHRHHHTCTGGVFVATFRTFIIYMHCVIVHATVRLITLHMAVHTLLIGCNKGLEVFTVLPDGPNHERQINSMLIVHQSCML